MAQTKCGFDNQGGVSGCNLLALLGPTLLVDIGFDPNFKVQNPPMTPVPSITGVEALVDTGATESCIDSLLASQLNLPVIDKKPLAGIGGNHQADIYMAQIRVPSLNCTIYGAFAGVHLQAGGQRHKALIGRTFLSGFTVVYEGKTGTVTISSD
jgi:predicted aspartyl protease